MIRHVIAAAVVIVDTALLVSVHGAGALWVAAFFVATVLLAYRIPLAGFGLAMVVAAAAGGAYALLIWASYRGGRSASSPRTTIALAGIAVGGAAVQLALPPAGSRQISRVAVTLLIFVVLPALVGRYLAQQERLVSALGERARLAERLRIARDMHDSLGRRLSLISIEAAALEVGHLPAREHEAVQRLAVSAREAMTEVYEVIGALRDPRGASAIRTLVASFRNAGISVTVRGDESLPDLPPAADQAAYRVVEEGLTNAAKHAPGRRVTVSLEPQSDTLLVTVANPAPSRSAPSAGGRGLTGLDERVRLAGGLLHHQRSGGAFRLVAMLPIANQPAGDHSTLPSPPVRLGKTAIGIAVGILVFVALPASLMIGAR